MPPNLNHFNKIKTMKKSTIKQINQDMKLRDSANRVRKVPIKSIKPHSNFANEIQSLEKSDKFFNRITITLSVVAVVLLAIIILK